MSVHTKPAEQENRLEYATKAGTADILDDSLADQCSAVRVQRKAQLVLLALAFVVTLLVGSLACFIEWKYFTVHSFFYDPASYMLFNAMSYQSVLARGQWRELVLQFADPSLSYPLRTMPIVFLAPSLLASPLCQLATAVPSFFCLAWLFGLTAFNRSGSLVYAIACMLVLAAIPGWYSPTEGLATYWLDVTSGALLGCAALTLINYANTAKIKWLVFFSLFVSAATLSRYVAIVYAAIACYPALMFVIFKHVRSGMKRNYLGPALITVACLPLLLTGWFLIGRAQWLYVYYGSCGYGLKQPISLVIPSELNYLQTYLLSKPISICLLAAVLANMLIFACSRKKNTISLAVILFPPIAFLMFATFVLRSVQNGYILWHAIPLLLVAALIPMTGFDWFHASKKKFASLLLIVASVFCAASSVGDAYNAARRTDPTSRAQKSLDKFMGSRLNHLKPGDKWTPFFDEYGAMPSLESFYQTKQLHLAHSLFTSHMAYWKVWHKGLGFEQLADLIYSRTQKEVSLAFVFDDPQMAVSQGSYWLDNEWSKKISAMISAKLRDNPDWKKVSVFDSPKYGRIAAYEKIARVE